MDVLETITAANKILISIENMFNTNSVVLPARRYITVGGQGTVAYDCEQLTVSWEQTYSGKPGSPIQEISTCNTIRSGVFVVELVRPIPVSQQADIPPETFLIQEAAEGLMKDAVLLYNAGLNAAEGSILDGGLADVTVGAPAGGYQSIIMTVVMPV
jgi:hypothetical protein